MIVSAVADPTVFGKSGITDELSKREAIAFLEGIKDNGVMLDDPTMGSIREALTHVGELSTKLGQRIQILLVEIRKEHKKFIARCDNTSWQKYSPTTIPERCATLAKLLKGDVIVTHLKNHGPIRGMVDDSFEVLQVGNVSQSQYEERRRGLLRFEDPLDELPPTDVEEMIGRAVKYASIIRFFDYRMVASEKRAEKYLAGIQFIVAIWEKWCVVGDPNSRRVELYTIGNSYTQSGFLSGADADSRLADGIETPLNAAITATVNRFVKQDAEPPIFHARGFQAKKRAFTVDPGFDAIGPSGPVRRCLSGTELAAERHFEDCRKLKDLP